MAETIKSFPWFADTWASLESPFCPTCNHIIAHNVTQGRCPYCNSEAAHGDQCPDCKRTLKPSQLINPKCTVCHSELLIQNDFEHAASQYFIQISTWHANLVERIERLIKNAKTELQGMTAKMALEMLLGTDEPRQQIPQTANLTQ